MHPHRLYGIFFVLFLNVIALLGPSRQLIGISSSEKIVLVLPIKAL